jgi:hypothetical protein
MRVTRRGLLVSLLVSLAVAAEAWGACPVVHRSRAVLGQFQRLHPCPSTGRTTGACPGYVKDHVQPLCLTGQAGDVVANLQWQDVKAAKAKDRLERAQCRRVCGPRPPP